MYLQDCERGVAKIKKRPKADIAALRREISRGTTQLAHIRAAFRLQQALDLNAVFTGQSTCQKAFGTRLKRDRRICRLYIRLHQMRTLCNISCKAVFITVFTTRAIIPPFFSLVKGFSKIFLNFLQSVPLAAFDIHIYMLFALYYMHIFFYAVKPLRKIHAA